MPIYGKASPFNDGRLDKKYVIFQLKTIRQRKYTMRLQWKYLHNRDSKTIFSLVTITTYPWDSHPRETGAQPVWDTTCNVLRCFPRGRSSINSPTGSSLRDTRGVLVRHINWSSFKVKRNFSENATPWNIYTREILYSQKHNYDLTEYGVRS